MNTDVTERREAEETLRRSEGSRNAPGRWRKATAARTSSPPCWRTDGYEAARRMRAERWGAGMHLVAISGWSQAADVARTRAPGFDAHFAKPVDPERVLDALKQRVMPTGEAANGSADERLRAVPPEATQEAS